MQEMTVKEKDNFFLNNPEIYRLCVGIQLCLIAGWEIRNVKNKLNSILNENFTEWQDKRHEIIKIFESIIKILSSKEQKDLFLKQIPTEFFAFFLHAPAAKRCRYENLVETFQENFIKPAIDYFDIKSTGNLLTQLKPGLQICHEKLAAIKRNVDSTRKNYLLFFMVIVFTAMVAASIYFYGFTHPFTFIFASILGSNFGFSIGAGYKLYSERKKAYSEYTLREWQTFIENKTLPNLTKVVIHNPHKQEKEIVYFTDGS